MIAFAWADPLYNVQSLQKRIRRVMWRVGPDHLHARTAMRFDEGWAAEILGAEGGELFRPIRVKGPAVTTLA
jgi:hypothetical protein